MQAVDLGQRIGVHFVRLAQVHVRVSVEHTVAHEVKPAAEVLGLLRDTEVLPTGEEKVTAVSGPGGWHSAFHSLHLPYGDANGPDLHRL